ncbi:asparagine synthase (glutamine-hydrolyzing) [Pseudodesulfovibrio portus]|uniref:asparagine synthase (glutamine-hydrolyzing) n=1 Tax=Pseudodesulfovibrio portus TaxID=231439 RepID=A0ABM8ATL9_9BACT|nr:asparagine synthase (glutamine-hydrolyzing) [Pseudodesulfovibrio portus]BDQ34713.1 asparagine synthetase B [Pseudodesulfovibrio portus]
MCGIAGILRHGGPPPGEREIAAMTAALDHRGPDGSATRVRDRVALGHTRLSIIDLSDAASQPMVSEDGNLALTFNGEICNYRELRRELEQAGCRFRTTSDTEVILHAYARWGEDCVGRFNGMFAFCIADHGARRLFLARDHAGIKPLYYRVEGDYFAFASTLGALRKVEGPPPRGSLQSIDYFLRYQYIPAPDTIYHSVHKLPPAHTLTVEFDGAVQPPERYWRLGFNGDGTTTQADVDRVLAASVDRWMTADVPVGIFLSGGIDSTCVASLASRMSDIPMKAFSIGFSEAGYSELEHAEKAARTLGLEFFGEVIKGTTLEVLPELVEHYGEPFGDASAIPTWHVSRLARAHVKTVLSGDGGDEAFGGYDRFFAWVNGGRWSRARRRELAMDFRAGRLKSMRAVLDGLGFGPEAWTRFVCYTFYPQRMRLWRPEHRHLPDTPSSLFDAAYGHARKASGMGYCQSMDFETYLPGAVLAKVDTASMYHGLEVRPAMLDRELLEVAAKLPEELKYTGGTVGKVALQRVLENDFSPEFIRRRKQGFGIPRADWTSPGQLGWEMLTDLLLTGSSPLFDWLERSEVERHVRMHEQGLDNSQHVWLLLVLALWAEKNSDIVFQ